MTFEQTGVDCTARKIVTAYSASEIASLLNVPKNTVYREIRKGALVARRVGKYYRVHSDCLDEYLKCLDPGSQHVSTKGPTLVNGSFVTAARIPEPDYAAQAKERRLKRRLQDI